MLGPLYQESGDDMKRSQSVAELKQQLSDQMGFLRASAQAFDDGDVSEAKRLAVALRVLLHESKQSHSLLGQLGQLQRDFLDLSFPPVEPGNLLAFGSLIEIVKPLNVPNAPARYMAPLDSAPSRLLPFKQWWEAKVFQHPDGSTLSRKQLVLEAANKDGGAHVDPQLGETYARFSRENAMGLHAGAGNQPIHGATQTAIRQIAHETLRTLDASYRKKQSSPPGVTMLHLAGASMTFRPANGPMHRRPKVGRNDPCPCGSKKKAKKCHPNLT